MPRKRTRRTNLQKSPSQLIEERVDEMGPDTFGDLNEEFKYTCMDTGMIFETYGEPAAFSPYTGSPNIMEEVGHPAEAVNPNEYMKPTGIPPSQANMHKQVPIAPNPAATGPGLPPTTQVSPNPAPDVQGVIGAPTADPRGFLPYPQQSMQPGQVPPHVTKKPGERTG